MANAENATKANAEYATKSDALRAVKDDSKIVNVPDGSFGQGTWTGKTLGYYNPQTETFVDKGATGMGNPRKVQMSRPLTKEQMKNGEPQYYNFEFQTQGGIAGSGPDGEKTVWIQDHYAGHPSLGTDKPHFHVRVTGNDNTVAPGCRGHYYYKK